MRIGTFIDTANFGGAESIALSIATGTLGFGHTPVLYHFGNSYLEDACHALGIENHVAGNRFAYKKTYRLPLFAFTFGRTLRRHGIDLLHSHLFGPIVAGSMACKIARIPHVGTLHDVYIVQERPARAKLLSLAHFLGSRLVCVSDQMAHYYASVTRIPAADLRVIKNGVDLARYRVPSQRRATGGGPVRFVSVGRLDRIKRHDLLFRALAAVDSSTNWQLSVAGDGPEKENLERLAKELNLETRIRFLGHCDDVPQLLAEADVFFLVSDSEGMSLCLVEAVASGLPIIATRVGNNAELVRHEWNGVLIEAGDRVALTKAIETLLEDESLRGRYAENSRQAATQSLDLRAAQRSYLDLYEALTAGT